MKKLLLIALIAVGFVFNSHAQDTKFGLKAGLNFANTVGSDVEDASSITSLHFGGFAEFSLSEKFSLQPELVYSAQGTKQSNIKVKLNYLNLPVLAKYYVSNNFSLESGPQLGFLLSADVLGVDIKDEIESTDFSWAFGLGYQLESGLGFAARYNLGLSSIAKDFEGESSKVKNSVIQLSVAYTF